MVFTPHNYLLGDPSQQSSQRIRINYDDEKATDVEKFGQQLPSGSVDLVSLAPRFLQGGADSLATSRLEPLDVLRRLFDKEVPVPRPYRRRGQ